MHRVAQVIVISVVATFLVGEPPLAQAQEAYTYGQLVHRLIDLEHLATLPAQGETSQQWSSYDRNSRYDEATGKYVAWASNGDAGGAIRTETDGSKVLAEMNGPGCLWRFWTAIADAGHIEIYLDGQERPVVDLPCKNYFDGKTAPFNYPMLSYDLSALRQCGLRPVLPDSLSEVVQDRRQAGLGLVLPFQLHDVS